MGLPTRMTTRNVAMHLFPLRPARPLLPDKNDDPKCCNASSPRQGPNFPTRMTTRNVALHLFPRQGPNFPTRMTTRNVAMHLFPPAGPQLPDKNDDPKCCNAS